MNNSLTMSLCDQDQGQKRNRSEDDGGQKNKPPSLRGDQGGAATTSVQSPQEQGGGDPDQRSPPLQPPANPQQQQQPHNSILQSIQGLFQAQQQPGAGANALAATHPQVNPMLSNNNAMLSQYAAANGNMHGVNLAAALGLVGVPPQQMQGGFNQFLGLGMPPPNHQASAFNMQGLQVDADLLRVLLMAQPPGYMQMQPQAPGGVAQAPNTTTTTSTSQPANHRPDPPAAGGAAAAASVAAAASAPVNLQLLQSLVAVQTNPNVASAVPAAAATAATAASRPRPHQSHLVDNSGTRRQLLYVPSDDESISPYQAFARQNIELFEAKEVDVQTGAQGRNKPVRLGQVGIRCIHCADLHPKLRARASVYYPSRLTVLYQAAQNIVNVHLPELCESIPPDVRKKLIGLDNKRSSVGGGKNYWSDTAQIQGVVDTENGLRFSDEKQS